MKTCIVIGAHGFIGSAIVAEAQQRGYAVTAVDRDNYEAQRGASATLLINANGNSASSLTSATRRKDSSFPFLPS